MDGFKQEAKVRIIDKELNESLDNMLSLSVGGKAKLTCNLGEVGKATGLVNGMGATIEGFW
jgi:hypothetical protein